MNTDNKDQSINNENQSTTNEKALDHSIERARNRVESNRFLKPGTYEKYIDYLRTKPVVGSAERHHVLPKHVGGGEEPANIVKIAIRDHVLAHLLRYLETKDLPDFKAYILRKSTQDVDMSSHGKRRVLIQRALGTRFCNPEVQRELGKKGGAKGGFKNTQAQYEARSKVGRSNQSEYLKFCLSQTLVFQRKAYPDKLFYVGPCESVRHVIELLNSQGDAANLPELKLDLKTRLNPLVRGDTQTCQNWSIVERISNV